VIYTTKKYDNAKSVDFFFFNEKTRTTSTTSRAGREREKKYYFRKLKPQNFLIKAQSPYISISSVATGNFSFSLVLFNKLHKKVQL